MLLILGLVVLFIAGVPYAVYLLWFAIWQPTGSPANKQQQIEPVSIVLPTYNEADIVESTLKELCSLEYPADKLELVVVDSSDDDTAKIVREFFADREYPKLTLITEDDRGGVARAVNAAVESASHDIIFRTDCDSRLDPATISHAVANLQNSDIGGVTGRQTEVLGGSLVEHQYRSMQAQNQTLESHLDSTFIIHGPCFAFRRELFEPIPAHSLADDTEIAVTIRKQGKRIVMDPAMMFIEAGVSDIRGRRQRKDRRAMGLLQLLVRHRDLLGRYGTYGRVVVPFNWWFLAISPWLTLVGQLFLFVGLLSMGGIAGVLFLAALGVFVVLGHRDLLGPVQPMYAVYDAHISLVIATVRLLFETGDGTWNIDSDSRELFEEK